MTNITLDGLPAKTGTISDAGIIHYREGGVDKKMTVADFLIRISEEYSADINTFLGAADKAAGRAALGIARRTAVSNADYTILVTDKVVAQIGTMSAARTFTLPTAALYPAGEELVVVDQSGTVTNSNKITVSRASADTIDGATSIDILEAYGQLRLISDGTSKWKISNSLIATLTELDAWVNKLKFVTPYSLANRSIPCFRAYLGSDQVITTSTNTKLNMNTESFDTHSWYDSATNYRFTPKKAGYYQFNCQVFMTGVNTNRAEVKFYKNGVEVSRGDSGGFTSDMGFGANDIIYLNGSTDYVELYLFHYSASSKTVYSTSPLTYWSAHLIA